MTKKRSAQRRGNKVLGSYQRVGTKFVPPLLQAFRFDHVSWFSHTMPELVWWDILADRTSHQFAAKVAEEIAPYFKAAPENHWWAFISDYTQISEDRAWG